MTSVETVLWYPFNLLSNGPMIFPGTCPTQAVNKDKRRIGLLASRKSMFYCQVLKLLLLEEVIVITL